MCLISTHITKRLNLEKFLKPKCKGCIVKLEIIVWYPNIKCKIIKLINYSWKIATETVKAESSKKVFLCFNANEGQSIIWNGWIIFERRNSFQFLALKF